MDDTLWDLITPWLTQYNDITGDNVSPEDVKDWDIGSYLNKGNKDMLFYVLEVPTFWEKVHPFSDSQMVLKKMMADEHLDVYICTATYHNTLAPKYRHFLKLFPFVPENKIITMHNKSLLNVDVMIDDKPDNLMGNTAIKIVFDRNHNRYFDPEELASYRVKSLGEGYELIKGLFNI